MVSSARKGRRAFCYEEVADDGLTVDEESTGEVFVRRCQMDVPSMSVCGLHIYPSASSPSSIFFLSSFHPLFIPTGIILVFSLIQSSNFARFNFNMHLFKLSVLAVAVSANMFAGYGMPLLLLTSASLTDRISRSCRPQTSACSLGLSRL